MKIRATQSFYARICHKITNVKKIILNTNLNTLFFNFITKAIFSAFYFCVNIITCYAPYNAL